jgi:hypothetical protein
LEDDIAELEALEDVADGMGAAAAAAADGEEEEADEAITSSAAAAASRRSAAARKQLPFTFPAPENVPQFMGWIEGRSAEEHATVIQRIRVRSCC